MTGHGHGFFRGDGMSLSVEIRTVNSRYAKVNVRCGENYQTLEPRIEELVRGKIRRGTIQVSVRIERQADESSFVVNEKIIERYLNSVSHVAERFGTANREISVEQLLGLPGVIVESVDQTDWLEQEWPRIEETLNQALTHLDEMRIAEGASMERDLLQNCDMIEKHLDRIEQQAPCVGQAYQTRLLEKLNSLLHESGTSVSDADIVREVGIFADRIDISEETVRLRTHINQFRKIVGEPESQGRKLDFLTQEMFRETNTIGSKANDAEIAQQVVEIKTSIERIREMVQNIE